MNQIGCFGRLWMGPLPVRIAAASEIALDVEEVFDRERTTGEGAFRRTSDRCFEQYAKGPKRVAGIIGVHSLQPRVRLLDADRPQFRPVADGVKIVARYLCT